MNSSNRLTITEQGKSAKVGSSFTCDRCEKDFPVSTGSHDAGCHPCDDCAKELA